MPKSIIFVDSRVTDYQSLINSLAAPAEVFVLDGASDGLARIAAYLQGRTDLDAIHIISHGSQGALYLGSSVLESGDLTSYQSQLASIGGALTETGDILLYGCNVAQGNVGLQFVTSLAQYTGADVAASSDATGAAALGGDWVLELSVGDVEARGFQISGLIGLLAGSAEVEPNNSVATANALALSTPVIGKITTSNDLDYYKVSIAGSGLLSLAIDVPTNSTLDYYKLGLYSGTGSLVAAFTTGMDKTFQTPVAAAGDYYVSIGPGTYYGYSSLAAQSYSLTVASTPGATSGYESEPNNSVATSDAIALSAPVIGQITTSSDLDYYKVSITGAGMLSLAIDVPTNSTLDHYKLALYSGTGILLSAFATGNNQTFQTPVWVAGDYYISVGPSTYYSYEDSAVNQYSLTIGNTLGATSGYESESNNEPAPV